MHSWRQAPRRITCKSAAEVDFATTRSDFLQGSSSVRLLESAVASFFNLYIKLQRNNDGGHGSSTGAPAFAGHVCAAAAEIRQAQGVLSTSKSVHGG